MRTEHDPDQFLYRIISFDRLVQMLEKDEWYFSHPSAWEDPYETRTSNELSHTLFAQCWCRKGVSDAMWRIYSNDKLGVRIRTTREKLTLALLKATKIRELGFRVSNVKYINELEYVAKTAKIHADLKANVTFFRASAHLLLKRRAFSHEVETRVVIFDPAQLQQIAPNGIKVSIDTRRAIDSVLVDPRAPDEFVSVYQHYLKDRLQFKGSVRKSGLYTSGSERES